MQKILQTDELPIPKLLEKERGKEQTQWIQRMQTVTWTKDRLVLFFDKIL